MKNRTGTSYRKEILEKINELEKKRLFDTDVEDDPPFTPIEPGEVDFLRKKFTSKVKRLVAYTSAYFFFERMLRKKQVIFKGVEGLNNLDALTGGAIVTCNHFNVFDNYAVRLALRKRFPKTRMYKLVREGNYALPGRVGFIMRNCDTIPLCKNRRAMLDCLKAVKYLLVKKKFILIYPEQGMWWNYRKPRPLKSGAFRFAAFNNAPVIPCFITLNDSPLHDSDGFPVQEYTVHILPLIYPDPALSVDENQEIMKNKNFEMWKSVYERVYGLPLKYLEE